jgi:DNA-binding transcriptional ArsR family regulator
MSMAADVDRIFGALADPTRRRLLELLGSRNAGSATALAAEMPVSRQAVAKHLAILEESELVQSHRSGRELLYTVRPERLVETSSWMAALAAGWEVRLQMLKRIAESAD